MCTRSCAHVAGLPESSTVRTRRQFKISIVIRAVVHFVRVTVLQWLQSGRIAVQRAVLRGHRRRSLPHRSTCTISSNYNTCARTLRLSWCCSPSEFPDREQGLGHMITIEVRADMMMSQRSCNRMFLMIPGSHGVRVLALQADLPLCARPTRPHSVRSMPPRWCLLGSCKFTLHVALDIAHPLRRNGGPSTVMPQVCQHIRSLRTSEHGARIHSPARSANWRRN